GRFDEADALGGVGSADVGMGVVGRLRPAGAVSGPVAARQEGKEGDGRDTVGLGHRSSPASGGPGGPATLLCSRTAGKDRAQAPATVVYRPAGWVGSSGEPGERL